MPLRVEEDYAIAGTSTIPLTMFSELVGRHLLRYTTTKNLEDEALALQQTDPSDESLRQFIRHVCNWGGYPGIAQRVINRNEIVLIRRQFKRAIAKLDSSPADVEGALQSINHIDQLGSPSFASKHLRFLRPAVCPILDSILAGRLNYRFSTKGYKSLSDDCLRIAEILHARQIANPMNRAASQWYAADVEMAIFAQVNNL